MFETIVVVELVEVTVVDEKSCRSAGVAIVKTRVTEVGISTVFSVTLNVVEAPKVVLLFTIVKL